jgi:hypothetical protein
MRTTIICCAILISLSCATGGGSSKPAVNWPAVAKCTDIGHSNLLGTVQDVLLNPDVEPTAELERLAQEHGAQMVACVVDQAVEQFAALLSAPQTKPMSAEPTTQQPASDEKAKAAAAATRGRDFLQRVGTTVEGEGQ